MWKVVAIDNQSGAGLDWSDGREASAERGPEGSFVSLFVGPDRFINFADVGAEGGHWAVRVNGLPWYYEGTGQASLVIQSNGQFAISGGVAPMQGAVDNLETLFFREFERALFAVPASAMRHYATVADASAGAVEAEGLRQVESFCTSITDANANATMRHVGRLVVQAAVHESNLGGVATSAAVNIGGNKWIAAAMGHVHRTGDGVLCLGLLAVLAPAPPAGASTPRSATQDVGGMRFDWMPAP